VRGLAESTNILHGSGTLDLDPRFWIQYGSDTACASPSTSSISSTGASTSSMAEDQDASPPPVKRSKLFACYTMKTSSVHPPTDIASQIRKYLDSDFDSCNIANALSFWNSENIKNEYCQLYNAAIRVLSVPASSAAIERVFSQGGLIAVPHRVGMTDKTLSSLIFLKCNFNMNL
jgi:hypothetical protein